MPVISKPKSYNIEARRGEDQPWVKVTDVQEDLLSFAQHWVKRENYVHGGANWRVAEYEQPGTTGRSVARAREAASP